MDPRTIKKYAVYGLGALMLVFLFLVFLGACVADDPKDKYPLESVNRSGSATSYIYRAANTTVPTVARELSDSERPTETSATDLNRMFLVYPDKLYNIQQDPKKTDDVLIEVSNRDYVKKNYDSDFLTGYLVASILDEVFDVFESKGTGYRGYSSRDTYAPKTTYSTPTPEEKKAAPPATVQSTGSITKRGDNGKVGSSSSKPATTTTSPSKSTTVDTKTPPKTTVNEGTITKRSDDPPTKSDASKNVPVTSTAPKSTPAPAPASKSTSPPASKPTPSPTTKPSINSSSSKSSSSSSSKSSVTSKSSSSSVKSSSPPKTSVGSTGSITKRK